MEKESRVGIDLKEIKVDSNTDNRKSSVQGETSIHLLSLRDVAKRLDTNIDEKNPKQSPGLTQAEAERRLRRDGPNELTPPKETPEIVKYLMFYLDPFMILLMGAGILCTVIYSLDRSQPVNLWIAIVLYVVTFISSTFAYVQAGKASAVMKSFTTMLPRNCHAIRDGKRMDIPARTLVVGDMIYVATGDQVPADARVIYVSELKVETASLTGESHPISVTTATTEERAEEAKNLIYNTSQCLEGEAVAVVYATGDRSIIGKIARLASHTSQTDSTLQREIKLFVKRLTIFAFICGVIFFAIGMARGRKFLDAFINCFVIIVIAWVPEGLPMTVVSCLSITAKKLADKKVFVKQLQYVETLGSATVIASDKTGTLTQNKMSVSRLWFDLAPVSVEAAVRDFPTRYVPMPPRSYTKEHHLNIPFSSPTSASSSSSNPSDVLPPTILLLERIAICNNRARFDDHKDLTDEEVENMEAGLALQQLDPQMTLRSARQMFPDILSSVRSDLTINKARQAYRLPDDSQRKVMGDASETALFNFVRMRQSAELMRYHNPVIFEIPFNSRNKFSLVITKPNYKSNNKGISRSRRRVVMIKGAPEVIMKKCNRYLCRGQIKPIDEEFTEAYTQAYETFGGNGERVLGFAQIELDEKEYGPEKDGTYSVEANNFPTTDFVFVGLISLIDPPKETVFGAVTECRGAGIRVIMVTGDHPLTAAAIARQVGILTTPTKAELAKIKECKESEIDEWDAQAIVVKGTDIETFTQQDWDRVLSKKEIVFARTTPQHKLAIVENLQRLGEVVAVTGDGVNDSPALKRADIGIAMGISGSDVARDAGDVILMDDDFASIVLGIKEGRTIFGNLMKTVAYTVTHLVPEAIPTIINLIFGIPLCISTIMILVIDLGTELAPAISFAYEKAESDVMNRPPRNVETDHLVNAKIVAYCWVVGIIQFLIGFMGYALTFEYNGIPSRELFNMPQKYFVTDADPYTLDGVTFSSDRQLDILAQAQTCYWAMLVGSQLCHVLMGKTRFISVLDHGLFGNMVMNYGVIISASFMIMVVYIPWSQPFFGTADFPGKYWALLLFLWCSITIVEEVRKYFIRKFPEGRIAKVLGW